MSTPLVINGVAVKPGSRVTLELPLPQLYTDTSLTMPVHVIRGRREGPRLFVCAAIHGDELNGVEIIFRLLKRSALKGLRGSLIAIPMVNVYGIIHQSRYLPDRRDLNRSFPGSDGGSMAARVAHTFMSEIVSKCTHGIDLHTGAIHRSNLPQIRGNLKDEETARLARAFGVPVLIDANLRDGSLRQAAGEHGIHMLLYEAGEALRCDEVSIRAGVRGIIRVMRALDMLSVRRTSARKPLVEPFIARSSAWVRAPESGILRAPIKLGRQVQKDDTLGVIVDANGTKQTKVKAPFSGVLIGRAQIPLVHEGGALFHLARFEAVDEVAENVEIFQDEFSDSVDEIG